MSKVLSAHAVSFDGYISGRTPDGVEDSALEAGLVTRLRYEVVR
jgi:hypothetical protein